MIGTLLLQTNITSFQSDMMYKMQDNIRSMLQNMHEAKVTESEQAEEIQQAQEEVDTRPRKAYYKVERVEEVVLKESKEG